MKYVLPRVVTARWITDPSHLLSPLLYSDQQIPRHLSRTGMAGGGWGGLGTGFINPRKPYQSIAIFHFSCWCFSAGVFQAYYLFYFSLRLEPRVSHTLSEITSPLSEAQTFLSFFLKFHILFIYCAYVNMHATLLVWELVFSLHHVGTGEWNSGPQT